MTRRQAQEVRRVPLLPTLLVAAAVATMIGLGVWQLQRREWKDALLARYERTRTMSSDVPWPRTADDAERALFRHTRVVCARVLAQTAGAGRSLAGESGWAATARCALAEGGEAEIALGWSKRPVTGAWRGGEVFGVIAPGGRDRVRLVAGPPLAGLAPLAPPDPSEVPNDHLGYALQWFFFAAAAAAIYALALRKRWRT